MGCAGLGGVEESATPGLGNSDDVVAEWFKPRGRRVQGCQEIDRPKGQGYGHSLRLFPTRLLILFLLRREEKERSQRRKCCT